MGHARLPQPHASIRNTGTSGRLNHLRLQQNEKENDPLNGHIIGHSDVPGQTSRLSPADFKLRRFAGVSEAGACCRNPERSAAESKDLQRSLVPRGGLEPPRAV